ncbi:MAG: hypothetical protein CL920_18400 [Deltaproteobacteria bacterium]|nr:hypothetical protein [Deltaproteobacteria bacterium]MBU50654.1 hypothetical protein [Deltaproteobacteria bacterium]|tara:strand:- start:2160 stop:4103 length:1944 start_codon:yes stop_codon:yes gene_type:complete
MTTYNPESLDNNYNNDLDDSALTGLSQEKTIIIEQTTNTLLGTSDLSENAYFQVVDGGVMDISGTLNVYSPSHIVAPPNMQIKTGSGTLQFRSTGAGGIVHSGWWGSGISGIQQAIDAISNAGGGIVQLPAKEISIPASGTISLKSNITLRGMGGATILKSIGTRTGPILKIEDVTNAVVEDLCIDCTNDTATFGQVELTGSSHDITIQNCAFQNGYAGIWSRPDDSTIEKIMLFNNVLENFSYAIYLGSSNAQTLKESTALQIIGNFIRKTQGSGIFVYQSITDLLIQNNIIQNCGTYGIELSKSGTRVSIIGNEIAQNRKHGIFIEPNLATDSEDWEQAKEIEILANIIRENQEDGLRISRPNNTYAWPYLLNISNNDIYRNFQHGIWCRGRQISIDGNTISHNCTSSAGHYPGVYIGGSGSADDQRTEYISFTNNHVVNNGTLSTTIEIINSGLTISDYVKFINVEGNTVTNDIHMPNKNVQEYGIWVQGTVTELLLKNNRVEGHDTEKNIHIVDGAGVTGERFVCKIGSYTSGDTGTRPLFVAPSNLCLVSAYYINAADITRGTNYAILNIEQYVDKDTNNTVFSTDTSGSGTIDGFEALSLGNPDATYKHILKDEVLAFEKTNGGTGHALDEGCVIIEYITI